MKKTLLMMVLPIFLATGCGSPQLPPGTPQFTVGETLSVTTKDVPAFDKDNGKDYCIPIFIPETNSTQIYDIHVEPANEDIILPDSVVFRINKVLVDPKIKNPEIKIISEGTHSSGIPDPYIRCESNISFSNSQDASQFLSMLNKQKVAIDNSFFK